MKLLNDGHWTFEDYRQVVNRKEAQEILKDRFHIVYGRLREFNIKSIGVGMYEVFKKPLVSAGGNEG
jgi:hypothetical protein